MERVIFGGHVLDLPMSKDLVYAWGVLYSYRRALETGESLSAECERAAGLLNNRTLCADIAKELSGLIAAVYADKSNDRLWELRRWWVDAFVDAFRGPAGATAAWTEVGPSWVFWQLSDARREARKERYPDDRWWEEERPHHRRRTHHQRRTPETNGRRPRRRTPRRGLPRSGRGPVAHRGRAAA